MNYEWLDEKWSKTRDKLKEKQKNMRGKKSVRVELKIWLIHITSLYDNFSMFKSFFKIEYFIEYISHCLW